MLLVLLPTAPDDISPRMPIRTRKSLLILSWTIIITGSLLMILLRLLITRYHKRSLFRSISNRIKRKMVMRPIPYAFRKTIIPLRMVRHSSHQSPVLLNVRLTDALRGVIFCLLYYNNYIFNITFPYVSFR